MERRVSVHETQGFSIWNAQSQGLKLSLLCVGSDRKCIILNQNERIVGWRKGRRGEVIVVSCGRDHTLLEVQTFA